MAFVQMKYVIDSLLKQFEFEPTFVLLLMAHMADGSKVLVNG
uniref:Uncharacterized protein n=1 Tax=Nelumbo nucifera TaxID=4432 RepID=A0A822XXK7_NELNU|nr:TPA_asm: hypothetical protein HUJ06_023591 [Nelumbo nucifera]